MWSLGLGVWCVLQLLLAIGLQSELGLEWSLCVAWLLEGFMCGVPGCQLSHGVSWCYCGLSVEVVEVMKGEMVG